MKFKVLSDVYNQYTVDIRTKAYALQFVFIIKAMVLLGGSILNFFVLDVPVLAAIEFIYVLVTIMVIILQGRGYYKVGWVHAIIAGLLIGNVMILTVEPTIYDSIYYMFCSMCVILLLSNFAVRRFYFIVGSILIYTLGIFYIITRGVPTARAFGVESEFFHLLYAMTALLVLGNIVAYVSWSSNRKLIESLREKEMDATNSLNVLKDWVHSFSGSMSLSNQLNTVSDRIMGNLEGISQLTAVSMENHDLVKNNINRISDCQSQILEANEGVKVRINNQSVAFEQTTAAIEEMSSSIENMSNSANEKIDRLTKITGSVKEGIEQLQSSVQIFDDIIESINKMSEIVSVIEDISERTNLLAMNASIESVHAGEAGKGFSIVAQSIRDLSEETSKNSKIIGAMIKKNILDVKNAVSVNIQSSENIREVGQEILSISSSLSEISHGLSELSEGTAEINRAIYHVSDLKKEVDISTGKMDALVNEENEIVHEVVKSINIMHDGMLSIDNNLSQVRNESEEMVRLGRENEESLSTIQDKMSNYQG